MKFLKYYFEMFLSKDREDTSWIYIDECTKDEFSLLQRYNKYIYRFYQLKYEVFSHFNITILKTH